MMRLFLIVILCIAALPTYAAERSMRIAAVVNEDAITESDIADRMRLILISSGLPNSPEVREKVLPQVMNSLIEERLMLQEAAENDITVDKEEIAAGFAELAGQNNFSPEQFKDIMQRSGIPVSTLERQIEAQIAWSKVIQTVLRPKITVKDTDVDVRQQRLAEAVGRQEYLVSEIFLPVEKPSEEPDVRKLANQLAKEIRAKKAPFEGVAQQFSKAAGADQGGSLGWVQKGQLPDELNAAIEQMQNGQVSDPVRTPAGLHILYLRDARTIEERMIPGRSALINQIGMERLDRLQRRTMQDLKAAAFIDRRV